MLEVFHRFVSFWFAIVWRLTTELIWQCCQCAPLRRSSVAFNRASNTAVRVINRVLWKKNFVEEIQGYFLVPLKFNYCNLSISYSQVTEFLKRSRKDAILNFLNSIEFGYFDAEFVGLTWFISFLDWFNAPFLLFHTRNGEECQHLQLFQWRCLQSVQKRMAIKPESCDFGRNLGESSEEDLKRISKEYQRKSSNGTSVDFGNSTRPLHMSGLTLFGQ